MPPLPPSVTHQLYARYRFRNTYTMEKVGRIRYEADPNTGLIIASRSLVKLMPVGGFDGFIMGLPFGVEAPSRTQPKRPAQLPDQEAMEDEALYNALYSQETEPTV